MNLKIIQVIGLNTDQRAAQVIHSARNGDDTFLAVLDLSCDDAFTRGRQALSELSDFYFDSEGSSSERLNATLKQAQEKFGQEQFSLLTASIYGKVLYFIAKGDTAVYLKRDDKLSPLLSIGAAQQLISGFLQGGDRLILSTKSLVDFLGESLTKLLGLPLDALEEEITDRIGASDLENQSLAALTVDVEEDAKEIPVLQKEEPVYEETAYVQSTRSNKFTSLITSLTSVGKILQNYFPKSGRGRLILAVFLIVVVALGVGFKVKSTQDAQRQVQFAQTLQGAKDDLSSAKGLATLNPAEAKSKLDSAKDKLNKALGIKPNDADAQNLKKQIEADSGSILQQSEVSDFPLFLDLDLIKKNFKSTQLSLSAGKLLLLDPDVKTLVTIDLEKKSNQILAGSEQLGETEAISLNGGLAFVYSKDKGVLRIDITNSKVTTVNKTDSDLEQVKDIYGFAGNVYLLDSGNNQIWKYLPTNEGYSSKREYFTKDTKADLANALKMQIESSIYVLKSGGEMLRFTKGGKDNFGYEGLDKGVKDPKSFFVSSDTDNLYLLDSGNSRLLILTKTGGYKGQMAGDKFGQASDLVVDEKGKKIYLLDGSKIFQIDLK